MSELLDEETIEEYYNDGVPLKRSCNCCGAVKTTITEDECRPWHNMGGNDILCPECYESYDRESFFG